MCAIIRHGGGDSYSVEMCELVVDVVGRDIGMIADVHPCFREIVLERPKAVQPAVL